MLDASTVLKELIENALDAHATRLTIRVFGKGACEKIEVVDNGEGIDHRDWRGVCLLNATSKRASRGLVGDLVGEADEEEDDKGGGFGFRGEALSGICGLSGRVVIQTRTSSEEVGHSLEYNTKGEFVSESAVAKSKGTTVIVEKLFEKYPVRLEDAKRNHSREIGKVVGVVMQYAIGFVGARFELRVEGRVRVMTTDFLRGGDLERGEMKMKMMKQNVAAVLGNKIAASLVEFAKDDLLKGEDVVHGDDDDGCGGGGGGGGGRGIFR